MLDIRIIVSPWEDDDAFSEKGFGDNKVLKNNWLKNKNC